MRKHCPPLVQVFTRIITNINLPPPSRSLPPMPPKIARIQSTLEYVFMAQVVAVRRQDPVSAKKCARILARKKREMRREYMEVGDE